MTVYLPTTIHQFVVPRTPWTIECDGFPFDSLEEAEAYAKRNPNPGPIYCRLSTLVKKANAS